MNYIMVSKIVCNLILISSLLSGCSKVQLFKNKKSEIESDNVVYDRASELFEKKKYKSAAEEFSNVYFQNPGSLLVPQAKLMEAYSLYYLKEYAEAADVLDDFIKLHPANSRIEEAYYLRALAYYQQTSGVEHDQAKYEQSRLALEALINHCPNTTYAEEGKQKLHDIIENIAGKHMYIGRFYQRTGNYVAALNRFNIVVNDYSYTSYYPEAIYRIAENYSILGQDKEVIQYSSILAKEYQDSKWYKYSLKLIR